MNRLTRLTIAATLAATVLGGSAASATEITFAVGGPITKIVDGYAAEFSKLHPDITVKPV
jgi:sn-glycerol 3-phosphate transport system substrate-binding protein